MRHLAFALQTPLDAHQAARQDQAAFFLEQFGPNHQIGDAGFILQSDEHHPLGRARPLAHQNHPGAAHEIAVAGVI